MSLAQRLNRGQLKRLLITSVAALLLATGTARAENVPSMYRGLWCLVGHQGETYRRCREADGEDYLEIQRSGIYGAAGDEEIESFVRSSRSV
jgi:hypothetical protein